MSRNKIIEHLDEALSRIPCGRLRRDAFKRLAEAKLAARHYVEVDSLLSRALEAYPRDRDLLACHALSANDRGLFTEALARWKAALEADPNRSLCWCGVAANLRSLNEMGAARATIEQALNLFRGEATVIVEAARIASACGDLDRALSCWNDAIAASDPHADWLFDRADTLFKMKRFAEASVAIGDLGAKVPDYPGLEEYARALQRVKRHCEDDQPVPREAALPEGMTPITPETLFSAFESLGDNCEFGLVQRYNHIEPLGLFRFAWSTTAGLVEMLSQRLENLGVDGDLELIVNSTDDSYDCRSVAYPDFRYHTEVFAGEIDKDVLLRREHKKVAYLKKRIVSDLTAGAKIFVRKGGGPIESGVSLFRVMRRFGPITLLWVELADDRHPPGSVEVIEEGFLRGYVSRFAPYGNAHDIDLSCWAEVCCNALAMNSKLSDRPCYALMPNVVYRMGLNWAFTPACDAQDVTSPSFPGLTTQRLTLLTDTTRDDAILAARLIDFELAPRALVVFSLWIWIPYSFCGSFVDVFVSNGPSFVYMADLQRRGVWQRVWTSARLPKGQRNAAVGLRVTGFAGDTVFIGGWRLESGSLPNDWSLDLRDLTTKPLGLDDGHRDRLGPKPV